MRDFDSRGLARDLRDATKTHGHSRARAAMLEAERRAARGGWSAIAALRRLSGLLRRARRARA